MHEPTPEDDDPSRPVTIPYRDLSEDALRGVIESFILREGTEYGPTDVSLEDKVTQVLAQLRAGEAGIVFDPATDSINIVLTGR